MKRRPPTIRCAIYCRRSVSDDSQFTSIDAQREACEAYVASQAHAGWALVRKHYNDMGFSGGTLQRPAMEQLLDDVERNHIDIIIVHKVDRLSRSLIDFARIADLLQQHGASFVSVTQQIDTSTPHGKLLMNQLLLFAEFERDMISDRTRTKMAAARKRGKHTGGLPVIGYDLVDKQLVINEEEAERVRAIFEMYLDHRSIRRTTAALNSRGWTRKLHVTATRTWGGGRWTNGTLHAVLSNVTYAGQVKFDGTVYPGEHEAIVAEATWNKVQELLEQNSNGATRKRTSQTPLLSGTLRCGACGESMRHTYATKNARRYRYYRCETDGCPTRPVVAKEIEQYVVDLVRERMPSTADAMPPQWTKLKHPEKIGMVEAAIERADYEGDSLQITWREPNTTAEEIAS